VLREVVLVTSVKWQLLIPPLPRVE
jgi:hypothetical protein